MVIDNKFEIGQFVYLTTDREQLKRVITGINIKPNGGMLYQLQSGTVETYHYELELATEKILEFI